MGKITQQPRNSKQAPRNQSPANILGSRFLRFGDRRDRRILSEGFSVQNWLRESGDSIIKAVYNSSLFLFYSVKGGFSPMPPSAWPWRYYSSTLTVCHPNFDWVIQCSLGDEPPGKVIRQYFWPIATKISSRDFSFEVPEMITRAWGSLNKVGTNPFNAIPILEESQRLSWQLMSRSWQSGYSESRSA